ncbi:DUF6881 domain-containing protein [Nocardia tengchongensis]
MLRQQELVNRIVDHLRSNAPSGWTEIGATYTAAGAVVGLDLEIDTPDGRLYDMGGPIAIPREVVELRKLMYTPGLGTWFTLHLLVRNVGDAVVNFDYGQPTPKPLLWLDFVGDLKMFPRSEVPSWILDQIKRQELEGIFDEAAEWLRGDSGIESESLHAEFAREGIDRALASQKAAGFIPEDPGCRYLEIVNVLRGDIVPGTVFCELWENGFQRRRIEIYSDGHIGLADEYRSEGCFLSELEEHTLLDEDPIPSIVELSEGSRLSAREIGPMEFQTEWLAAGGW